MTVAKVWDGSGWATIAQGPQGPVGPQGPAGAQGPQGPGGVISQVQANGVASTPRSALNLTGKFTQITDDAANNRTNIAITPMRIVANQGNAVFSSIEPTLTLSGTGFNVVEDVPGQQTILDLGNVIDIQTIRGNAALYSTAATYAAATNLLRSATTTDYLSLTYNPDPSTVRGAAYVWWEVTLNIGIVQKTDAAYHYSYGGLNLTPADDDGMTSMAALMTQHSTVDNYMSRTVTYIYKLSYPNGPYTVYGQFGPANGGTWSYYRGAGQLWMTGKVYRRDPPPQGPM